MCYFGAYRAGTFACRENFRRRSNCDRCSRRFTLAKYEFTSKGPGIIWLPFWLFVSARPRQWLKNLALFAPLIFEGEFFNPSKFFLTVFGFFIFSIVTSGIYIINDVIDFKSDLAHPYKRKRPIAAGKIDLRLALIFAISILIFALF